ncbi:putative reverse transcriptase domain-containing protein [Tanacetum coccineum]|uniref:Reverse transcriptase domain-containing protein n=1 Tax=Tanacetum coccineum TaxID=301880 RepID=A0ABQ5G8P7_9ASTR
MVVVSDDRVTHPIVPDDIPEPTQEEGPVEVSYETLGDLVQRFHDHTVEILVHRVQVNESIQRDQGHKIVASSQHEALEARDAARNLETLVEGGGEQEDENGDDFTGGNRGGNRNGRVNGNEGNGNGGNRNGGVNRNGNGRGNGNGNNNGNGNGNGGGNGFNFGGFMPVARVYTYQDFLKCQPVNFNGTKGVVGLTRRFEKMETVFHISNSPQKYQVKYATCTLLNSALTWWNSPKRTIRVDVAYDMKWTKLMKLMKEVYCLRNEIQKMETELWNLNVKRNDLTAYTRRFQELVLLCTRMVPEEEDKVERFIGGLPNNIQGNVITAEPTRLQDAIRIANNLMDQILKGYARSAENKKSADMSFVSSTFSALLGVAPSTLDISYAVELTDGIIS